MNLLCIGGSGFLGSVLIDRLLKLSEIDYVFNYDALFFGENVPVESGGRYLLINRRVEQVDWGRELNTLGRVDAVIWLAAISNDPASEINPTLTKLINHFSAVQLAYQCCQRGIKFIFASSASVYGTVNYACSVWSPTFPISLYAKEKLETERDLWSMANDDWQPIIIRMATLFGPSYRMRFDLAINKMVCDAESKGEVTVYGGQQYRPFLHISYAVDSYIAALFNAPISQGYIVNAADFNMTIYKLGEIISSWFGADFIVKEGSLDSRDYRIRGCKYVGVEAEEYLYSLLPELAAAMDLVDDVDDNKYYTVQVLKEILK